MRRVVVAVTAAAIVGMAPPAVAQPEGAKPAFFTHFWDAETASGNPMDDRTVASAFWPLGTRVEVGYGDNSIEAVVNDLGPADWVYEMHSYEHPEMAIIDLATPLMEELTGSLDNTEGWYRILEWGDGWTLYGFNESGYPGGPTGDVPGELPTEPEPEPEPVPSKPQPQPEPVRYPYWSIGLAPVGGMAGFR